MSVVTNTQKEKSVSVKKYGSVSEPTRTVPVQGRQTAEPVVVTRSFEYFPPRDAEDIYLQTHAAEVAKWRYLV